MFRPRVPWILCIGGGLSSLAWDFRLRRPRIHFLDADLHCRIGCYSDRDRTGYSGSPASLCGGVCGDGVHHSLEPRLHFSMGNAFDTAPRADLLARDGLQPDCGRTRAGDERLQGFPSKTPIPDEFHRGYRPATIAVTARQARGMNAGESRADYWSKRGSASRGRFLIPFCEPTGEKSCRSPSFLTNRFPRDLFRPVRCFSASFCLTLKKA